MFDRTGNLLTHTPHTHAHVHMHAHMHAHTRTRSRPGGGGFRAWTLQTESGSPWADDDPQACPQEQLRSVQHWLAKQMSGGPRARPDLPLPVSQDWQQPGPRLRQLQGFDHQVSMEADCTASPDPATVHSAHVAVQAPEAAAVFCQVKGGVGPAGAHLVCFPSLRDHCPSLSDVQCCEHYCSISSVG